MVRRIRPPPRTLLSALVTTKAASQVTYWDCFEVSLLIQPQYQLALATDTLSLTLPSPFVSPPLFTTNAFEVHELLKSLTDQDNLTQYLQSFYTSIVFRPEAFLLSLYYNNHTLRSSSIPTLFSSSSSDDTISATTTTGTTTTGKQQKSSSRVQSMFPSVETILQHPFRIGDQLGPFTVAHRAYIRTNNKDSSVRWEDKDRTNKDNTRKDTTITTKTTTTTASSSIDTINDRNGIEAALTWGIGNYSGYSYHAIIANDGIDIKSKPSNYPTEKIHSSLRSAARTTPTTVIPRLTFIFGTAVWKNNVHNHKYRLRRNRYPRLLHLLRNILSSVYLKNTGDTRYPFGEYNSFSSSSSSMVNGFGNHPSPLPPYQNTEDLIKRKLYPSIPVYNSTGNPIVNGGSSSSSSVSISKPWGAEWIWGPYHRGYSRLLLISAVDRHLRRNLL